MFYVLLILAALASIAVALVVGNVAARNSAPTPWVTSDDVTDVLDEEGLAS